VLWNAYKYSYHSVYSEHVLLTDRASFLGISVVGQSNRAGDGGIYVGSIMKGSVIFHCFHLSPCRGVKYCN